MNNNLTLSVTLTGDNRQLSGTLRDAQGDVRAFSTTTERESQRAETALQAPGRKAGTVSEHLRGAGREARAFGTETAQSGRQATQALTQTGNEAQTTAGQLNQLKAVAVGVGVAFTAMGVRDFINDTYAAVSSSQQLQASLKTVTGSLESATNAWDELLVFAAETPFTLDQSVQAFIRMQALGLNPTQEALRSFGNTAAAMGEDMMRMVEAVADATTGEFERLKAFGIRSAVEGDQIAFTFQGVTTRIRNSAADISAYLQSIGENQFAGAMADQMATLSGQSANLEDSIYQLYLAVGEAGATQAFENALSGASNTVQFLTDNIDALVSGAEIMAVLLGGRVAVALATVTAAKLAATQQTIAYQLALARMAGVSTTAAAGQVALAGATRAAAGALALVGGPLGAAMLAGGAIYYFREELGLVTPSVQSATDRVDDMTSALDANSEAALKNARAMLEAEQQFQQFRQATLTMEVNRQRQIVADEQRQWDAVGGQQAFGMGQASESQQALRDLQVQLMDTRNAIDAAGGSVTKIDEKLAQLERTTRETITPTTDLGDASETTAAKTNELTKATEAQASALEDLRNRLIPGRREVVQLARDMQTLTLAIATGTGNVAQNIQMMGLLQQQYIEAQNDTDDLADKTVKAAFTMEGAFDELRLNGLRRLDDGFADLWQGAIDGSLNASEIMKRVISQTLAEMAHMAITRPITVQLATSMGLGGGGTGSTGAGGFDLSPGGISNAWNIVQKGFGGNSIGQGITSVARSGYGALTGNAVSYGGSGWASSATAGNASWLNNPSNVSNISMGLQSIGGSYVGNELGSSMFGKQANSNIGSTIGAIAGSFLPIPGGTFIGSTLGGMVDSLFGSGKKTYDFDFKQGQHSYVFGDRTSAFGDSGLTALSDYKIGEQQDALNDMLTAMANFDNQLAAAAIPERFEAMKASIDGFTHSGPDDLFETRLRQMITGGQVLAADAVASIIDPERLSQAALGALQLEGIGQQLGEQALSDITAEIERFSGDSVVDAITRMTNAAMAADLLASASQGLNLQFDVTAAGAVNAAGSIAEMVGGMQNLTAIQQGYYQAVYSETERLSRSQTDLRAALEGITDQVPTTVGELRALVEAQNLNDAAAGELAVRLMELAPALKQTNDAVRDAITQQYQDALGRAPDAAGMDYWFNQVATGALTLEDALWNIQNSVEAAANGINVSADALRAQAQLERQLLQVQGNTAALRQLEIDELKTLNGWEEAGLVTLQERIWALQDEAAATREVEQAQQDALRLISRIDSARERQLNAELGAIETLSSLYNSLQLSSQSILDPMERMNEAQRQFAVLQVRAESGDTAAVRELQGASTAYLDTVAAYYGQSSEQYARVFRDVNSSVKDLEGQFTESVSELETIGNALDRASRDAQLSHREAMGGLRDLLEGLHWLPEGLAAEIDKLLNGQSSGGSVGGGSNSSGDTISGDYTDATIDNILNGHHGVDSSVANSINSAYRDVLGRDAIGYQFTSWARWLENGTGRAALLEQAIAWANLPSGGEDWLKDEGLYAQGMPQFATGAWKLESDQMAMIHKNEFIAPDRGGIADEFRAYAAGDYQAELMTEISGIKRSLSMPNLLRTPLPSSANSRAATPPAINLEPLTRELNALRQEVAQLRNERRRDAEHAAGQRNAALREQQKTNRNTKTRVPTL
ncbi:DUF4214 domain-containing protein [Halomonas sp. 7T]|uniref:DUF4214 domain-containing protein n=1 Tax=Halomonas sp. 7T TaxID=2893469 RepID=UPI0021DAC2AB|nr:DUF4214 domain-containing protein [Halomonas sp. 7T]UXZ55832.1 DUF4214 domain-containing protein [Halomonas sp. 7T]